MFYLNNRTVLRRIGVDDVDDAEHALVQGLGLRVRPPLEAVIHESETEGVGPVVDRSQIIDVHGDVDAAVRRPTCVGIIFSTPSTRREKCFTG